jgi:hypothetical protein
MGGLPYSGAKFFMAKEERAKFFMRKGRKRTASELLSAYLSEGVRIGCSLS